MTLNPYHLMGDFYRPFLQDGLNSSGFSSRAGIMLRNGIGHLLVVAAMAIIPVSCTILGWLGATGNATTWRNWQKWQPSERQFLLVAFAVFALAAMVSMTISFTAQIARPENGQLLRLHGRYYSFALPLFFIMLAMTRGGATAPLSRLKRALLLAAFISGALIIYRKFTIFPWDFPELALLTKLDGSPMQAIPKLAFIGSLLMLVAPASISIKRFFFGIWLVIFAASLPTMLIWQKTQTTAFIEEINAGMAAHLLLGHDGQTQHPAVVGSDRYGRMSYFLFNLAAAPRVIAADKPTDNLSVSLADASWLFSLYQQNLDLNNATATGAIGPVRYYRLDHAAPYTLERLGIWDREPIHLDFAAGRDDGLVMGGNKAEPWGTWTATETSVINLPALISGRVRLTLDGWVTPERTADELRIAVGDATAVLHLSDHREAFSVELQIDKPSRELVLSGISPWQPNLWGRPLAVAIVRLDIERATP